jgi:hypothetical protein
MTGEAKKRLSGLSSGGSNSETIWAASSIFGPEDQFCGIIPIWSPMAARQRRLSVTSNMPVLVSSSVR